MVERQSEPAILTYFVGERASDRWLQRTLSNAGERLGRTRDRVLGAAHLQRHHTVLDLNAGSGLLTWEILRRTPEGGTWALVRDRQTGDGLRQQAQRLPELERPVVLVSDPWMIPGRILEEVPELLTLRGEAGLRFDAIVGRNALGPVADKGTALRLLTAWLRPGGCLSLVDTVVRHSQRLYQLVDLAPVSEDLRRRIVEAEESIYANLDDPLVNWDGADLQKALEAAGFEGIVIQTEDDTGDMLISPLTVDRWFSQEAGLARPSYAQHLLRWITTAELAEVQALFHQQLTGQIVPWRSRLAFFSGKVQPQTARMS
jgi:putative ATPase